MEHIFKDEVVVDHEVGFLAALGIGGIIVQAFATCQVVLQIWDIAEVIMLSSKTLADSMKVPLDEFVYLLIVPTFDKYDLVAVWLERQLLQS